MNRGLLALLLLALTGGCQLTKEDFQPVHLRKGGGEPASVDSGCGARPQPKAEPKVEPKAEPEARPEIREVIYAIGLKGID
ncbi:hypothetical protein EDM80_15945 [bacterium]|nr:MAG: hypothetical protein EDM80_15945 [bacterium]RIK63564.1 MAG: hypothetical protein DCC64_06890 [Planctomycetota bacterium]